MSPEQWKERVTLKTDIWAFGCILLHFVTGLKPYHKLSASAVEVFMLGDVLPINPLEYIYMKDNWLPEFEIIEKDPYLK